MVQGVKQQTLPFFDEAIIHGDIDGRTPKYESGRHPYRTTKICTVAEPQRIRGRCDERAVQVQGRPVAEGDASRVDQVEVCGANVGLDRPVDQRPVATDHLSEYPRDTI